MIVLPDIVILSLQFIIIDVDLARMLLTHLDIHSRKECKEPKIPS